MVLNTFRCNTVNRAITTPFEYAPPGPTVPFEVFLNSNLYERFLLRVRQLRDFLKPFSLAEYVEQRAQHLD